MGITESSELLRFLGSFVGTTDRVLADGKVSIPELIQYYETITNIRPAVEGIKAVPSELADLDDEEREYLTTVLAESLDLRNDQAEDLVEDGFDLVLRLGAYIKRVADLRRPADTGDTVIM